MIGFGGPPPKTMLWLAENAICLPDYTLPRGLHDWMMSEAEPVIQHNWTSLALHIRYLLELIPDDHAFAWIVTPEGSRIMPTYCKLSQRDNHIKADENGVISQLQAFIIRCQDYFIKFKSKPSGNSYYFVVKRSIFEVEDVTPSTFDELLDLVFVGELKWTDFGIQKTRQPSA